MSHQLSLGLATPKFEVPKLGSTSWYKGERVTCFETQEMAENMTRVVYDDGRSAIVRTRLLGRWSKEQFNAIAQGVDRWF